MRGPTFYDVDDLRPIDTSSGMAAISALLPALVRAARQRSALRQN